MKQSGWSVWCQGEDIEKISKDQGRTEYIEFVLLSDHKSDYIGTSKNA